MLDLKFIRSNPEKVQEGLNKRNKDISIAPILELDEKRRKLLAEVEKMKAIQNQKSKEIPKLKKEGKDTTELMNELKELSDKIKELDSQVKEVEDEIERFC